METQLKETTNVVELKPYDIQKQKLKQLADDYKSLVVTSENLEEARKARKVIRDERFAIQAILKENKQMLNDFKSKQESLADELISIIMPTEEHINDGIQKIEKQKELEKLRKEKEAEDKKNARIATLFEKELKFDGEKYAIGELSITPVQIKVFSDQDFNEFVSSVDAELSKLVAQREAEALAKAEQERKQQIHMERKEMLIPYWEFISDFYKTCDFSELEKPIFDFILNEAKGKKAEFDFEKAEEAKRIAAEKRANEEAAEKLRQERMAFELEQEKFRKAQQEEQDKIEAEKKRIADEKAEKERKELEKKQKAEAEKKAKLLMPEKEILLEFAQSLDQITYPELKNQETIEILADATKMIESAGEYIKQKVSKL